MRLFQSLLLAIAFSVQVAIVEAASPEGRWRGNWTSQSTGHQGPMRAVIRPQSDGSYSARFYGRFLVVVPFTYRVDLHPSGACSSQWIAEKQLGPVLGSYRMQTDFGGSSMSGTFQAADDTGG